LTSAYFTDNSKLRFFLRKFVDGVDISKSAQPLKQMKKLHTTQKQT